MYILDKCTVYNFTIICRSRISASTRARGRYDDLEVEDDDDTPAFDFKG